MRACNVRSALGGVIETKKQSCLMKTICALNLQYCSQLKPAGQLLAHPSK